MRKLAWWLAPPDDVLDAVNGMYVKFETQAQARRAAYRRWGTVYGVDELGTSDLGQLGSERLSFNEAASIVDSLIAKVVKNRPLPQVTTEGASYSKRKRAQRLSRFIEGQFYDLKMYELAHRALLHALVYGTGALKLGVCGDSIDVANVLPHDLFAHSTPAPPRELFQRTLVDRGILADKYPDHKEAIERAPEPRRNDDLWETWDANTLVEVRYAWHLPSGVDATDGRYVCAIEHEVLEDEEYSRDEFPFVFLRPRMPLQGFWGPSLVKDLAAGQLEYDTLTEKIQRAHRMIGGAHFICDRGSNINYANIDNDIGSIITVTGPPPVVWTPQSVSPDTYAYLDRIRATMREVSGQSAMSVHAEKPSGITSGIALQTLDDVESERFMVLHRGWEQFFVDVARHIITLSDIIPNVRVKTKTSRGIELLHWSDVSLPEDESIVEIFPTSMLAKTPGARLEQLQEMFSAQVIDSTRFRQLLQMPDLEFDNELDASVVDVVDRAFDKMILDGDAVEPEPFDDLAKVSDRALKLYAHVRAYNDIPEERLELCRRYIEAAVRLQQPPTPPAPPAPELPPPMPEAIGPEGLPMPPETMAPGMPVGGPLPPELAVPPPPVM